MCILAAEYKLISAMQVIDREVFFYLAQRTDKRTGLIGKQCAVSYGGMALDLSERQESGRRKNLIVWTMKEIQHAVSRLVNCGVLRRESKSGEGNKLILVRVFFAEDLPVDKSVKNELGRRLGGRLVGKDEKKTNNNNSIEKLNAGGWESKTPEVGRTNIIYINNNNNRDDKFAMPLSWKPSEDELKALLFMAGGKSFSLDRIDSAWVSGFVGYWWSQQNSRFTQREWTEKLSRRLISYFRDPGLFDRLNGNKASTVRDRQFDPGNKRLPDWAKIPRDDNSLCSWANYHGYRDAYQREDFPQYRGALQRLVNERLQEKKLSKISF